MGDRAPWDLIVLGGGTAGIVGARTAAALGARVLLVERDRPGGDCLFTGCVPSKALLAAAHRAAGARRAAALGVHAEVSVDFPAVMHHVRSSIERIEPVDAPPALRAHGVEVLLGEARFVGPDTVEVDGRVIRFRHALLATGAGPALPGLPGLDDVEPLTTETVWGLRELPRRLVVLGAGSVGCELAQAFARLGSSVHLLEQAPHVLPAEDPDAAAIVRAALTHDGVRVMTGVTITSVARTDGGSRVVRLTDPHGRGAEHPIEHAIDHDELLVATGRRAHTDGLDLEVAGVALDTAGSVVVDARSRTSSARIWAAGDVTTRPQLTHVAGADAAVAAQNAVLGLRTSVDQSAIPRVTFTDPEVAAVGVSTASIPGRARDDGLRVVTRKHAEVDRAVADGRTEGFSRLVLDARSRIVGATLVGPRAGESLAEVTLAIREGLTTRALTRSTHPYPTYADGVWNAAIDDVQRQLSAPALRWVLGSVVRLRSRLARSAP